MNLKWMIDGVSHDSPTFPFCALKPTIGTCRSYIVGHSAQRKVCTFSLRHECRVQTCAVIGLIKQLADVGTALS
jgi:hypothetical protein